MPLSVEKALRTMMSPPLFPIEVESFKAKIEYNDFHAGDTIDRGDGIILRTTMLNHPDGATGYRVEFGGKVLAYLTDTAHEPTALIESHQRDVLASDGITTALQALDPRSRRIVEERWLKVNDDSSGGMTLHDLAAEYGVSAERIRQIEAAAMKKMKKTLAEYA